MLHVMLSPSGQQLGFLSACFEMWDLAFSDAGCYRDTARVQVWWIPAQLWLCFQWTSINAVILCFKAPALCADLLWVAGLPI